MLGKGQLSRFRATKLSELYLSTMIPLCTTMRSESSTRLAYHRLPLLWLQASSAAFSTRVYSSEFHFVKFPKQMKGVLCRSWADRVPMTSFLLLELGLSRTPPAVLWCSALEPALLSNNSTCFLFAEWWIGSRGWDHGEATPPAVLWCSALEPALLSNNSTCFLFAEWWIGSHSWDHGEAYAVEHILIPPLIWILSLYLRLDMNLGLGLRYSSCRCCCYYYCCSYCRRFGVELGLGLKI